MSISNLSSQLLRFVFAQSYAKSIGDTSKPAPTVYIPGLTDRALSIPLDWNEAGILDRLTYPTAPAAAPIGEQRWKALSALLYGAVGVLRFEPANTFNPHRGYPSARGLFPVHAYLLTEEHALRYDPVGHCLQPVGQHRMHAPVPHGMAIALAGCFGTFPEAYGPLRYALTILEAGHALYNLVLLASALGFDPKVHLRFSDEALLARLALPRDGSFSPVAIVSLGAGLPNLVAPPLPDIPSERLAQPGADPLTEIERATWLDGAHIMLSGTAASEAGGLASRQPVPSSRPLPPYQPRAPHSLGEVLYARNAGRGAAGLCGRGVPISVDVLSAAVTALRPPPLDLSSSARSPSGLRVFVAAERTTGLDDGIYELAPARAELSLVRQGRYLEALQAGFTYPPSAINIRSMNLVWLLAVDYPAVLERYGGRGLRLANLELGWLAQALGCAAAAEGLFARPVRSFREPVLDELLRLGPTEMIGYEVLCGSNRFSDFPFDLRPPTRVHGEQTL